MDDITLKLKESELERIGQDLRRRVEYARGRMRPMLDRMAKLNNLYEGLMPGKTFPWEGCSNCNVPLIQWVTDTYHAHVCDTITRVRPITLVEPDVMQDQEARRRAATVEQILMNVELGMMDLLESFDQVSLYALLFGTCVPKLAWRERRRKVGKIGNRRVVVVAKGPKLEFVDLRNFVAYPLTSPNVDSAKIIGDRYRLGDYEIEQKIKDGVFDNKRGQLVLDTLGTEEGPRASDFQDTRDEYEGIGPVDAEQGVFWELITPYDADKDGFAEDCVFTIEEGTGIVVRASELPYDHGMRHYIRFAPFLRPGRFFGRGVGEILEHVQRELNAFLNQWLDGQTIAMCKAFKLRRGCGVLPDAIQIHPGAVISLGDIANDLVEFNIAPMVSGVEVLSVLRDYAERALSVNDVSLGRVSEGDKTLGEVQTVQAEGGIRFGQVVDRFQRGLLEIAPHVMGLLDQFLDDDELASLGATGARIPGGDGTVPFELTFKREDLFREWDYQAHGNTGTANRTTQRSEALLLYRELLNGPNPNPLLTSKPERVHRITEDLLMAFDRRDVDAWIGSDQEAQELGKRAEEAQLAQATAAGGVGGVGPTPVGVGTGAPETPPGPAGVPF